MYKTDEQLRRDYGVQQTNGIDPSELAPWHRGNPRRVDWSEPGLKITRLRLLSDPGFPWWDVSYCYGLVGDEPVRVELPFDQLPKRGMRQALVEHARRDGVYLKPTGIFDNISTLC